MFVDDSRVPLTPNLINHLIYLNFNGSQHGVIEELLHGVGNKHYSFVSRHKIAGRWRSQHCTKPTLGGVTDGLSRIYHCRKVD